jgi:hypothetical protein
VAAYEAVALVGDVVVVGDVEMRIAQLHGHQQLAMSASPTFTPGLR